MHISQIRGSVAIDDLISTDEGGYRLNLSEAHIDVRRFTSLAREGLDRLRQSRFAAAAERLGAAAALRGDSHVP